MESYITPKVSVIVPNYNYAKYLKERIDSILSQTYQNFELIILDDCSTDNSRDIIEGYRDDSHVSKIIYNEVNTGSPFMQWETGINLCSGEWIWIAESDDKASPEFLSTLLGEIEKTPNAVLAFSNSHYIDSSGTVLFSDNINDSSIMNVHIYEGEVYVHEKMLWSNHIYNASMVLFSRRAYCLISKDYVNYRCCGDWLFWTNLCLQGKIIESRQKLNFFRQHSNRVTEKASRSMADWREVGSVLSSFVTIMNLKGLELKRFRGKWTNDFQLSHYPDKKSFKDSFPDVFNGTIWDIYYYKLYVRIKSRNK